MLTRPAENAANGCLGPKPNRLALNPSPNPNRRPTKPGLQLESHAPFSHKLFGGLPIALKVFLGTGAQGRYLFGFEGLADLGCRVSQMNDRADGSGFRFDAPCKKLHAE